MALFTAGAVYVKVPNLKANVSSLWALWQGRVVIIPFFKVLQFDILAKFR